jgi:RNA polymerase sigma factor for flagellar operon FliA
MTLEAYVAVEARARGVLDEGKYKRLLPVVRRAAARLSAEASGLGFSELGTWAWLGVLEAAEREDGDLGDDELEAYAVFRARSALLDALTSKDPRAPIARDLSARVTCAIRVIRAHTGKEPTSRAIAAELGISDETYVLALDELAESGHARLEVVTAAPTFGTLGTPGARKPDVQSALAEAIALLPEIQRALFDLHYGEGLPLVDAAEHIGISVGEARRLHTEAIHRLRAGLG